MYVNAVIINRVVSRHIIFLLEYVVCYCLQIQLTFRLKNSNRIRSELESPYSNEKYAYAITLIICLF